MLPNKSEICTKLSYMPKSTSNTTAKTAKVVKVSKANKIAKPTQTSTVRTKAPTSGRKKGFKKQSIEIRDSYIEPYYIICEDRQYIKMQTGSTMPQGYYTSLSNVIRTIIKDQLLLKKAGSSFTLSQFIHEYEHLQSKILSRIDI